MGTLYAHFPVQHFPVQHFPLWHWPGLILIGASLAPATVVANFVINSLKKMTTPTSQDDWPLYVPHLPDGDDVKTSRGVVRDTVGISSPRSLRSGKILDHPGIQLRIQSSDREIARAKIEDITAVLDETANEIVVVEDTSYELENLSRTSPIVYFGINRESVYTVNYLLTLKKL